LKTSITPSAGSFSETSAARPKLKFPDLVRPYSNSVSCVTPRSSVIASYLVRAGDFRLVEG
jgi:hypothetical protein